MPNTSNKKNKTKKINQKGRKNIFKLLLIVIIVLILVLVLSKIIKKKDNTSDLTSNTTNNTTKSNEINDIEFEGLQFSKITILKKDDGYYVECNIKNNNESTFEEKNVNIEFFDDVGNTLTSMQIFVPTIESGANNDVAAMTTLDITKTVSIKIENIEE